MTVKPQPASGILAIWNDCLPGREAEYDAWYVEEHLPERMAIAGFRIGRRYRALSVGQPGYFTCYETDTPEVMRSAAYLARVNAPTVRTRAIMAGTFLNMSRTVCRRTHACGSQRGGRAVIVRADTAGAIEHLIEDWTRLKSAPGVLRAEVWQAAVEPPAARSVEAAIRGHDHAIAACLLLEFGDTARAAATRDDLARTHAGHALTGHYELCCWLQSEDLDR